MQDGDSIVKLLPDRHSNSISSGILSRPPLPKRTPRVIIYIYYAPRSQVREDPPGREGRACRGEAKRLYIAKTLDRREMNTPASEGVESHMVISQ